MTTLEDRVKALEEGQEARDKLAVDTFDLIGTMYRAQVAREVQVDNRFDAIDRHFDVIDGRFNRLDQGQKLLAAVLTLIVITDPPEDDASKEILERLRRHFGLPDVF